MINCKDYYIIRVRYYADEKLLKKHYKETPEGFLPTQHHDRAVSYNKFQVALIERVTGMDFISLVDKYQFHSMKAGFEDMEEMSGIRYSIGEGWDTYMIPKEKTDLIEWFHKNLTENPFKVLKVIRLGFQKYREFPSTFWRKYAIENRIDFSKYK